MATILIRDGYSTGTVVFPFEITGGQFGDDLSGFSIDPYFFGIGGPAGPETTRFSVGDTVYANIPFAGRKEIFTAKLFGEMGMTFGLELSTGFDPGTITTTLPYQVSYAIPTLDPVQDDGKIIDLLFQTEFLADYGGFTTQFPSAFFELDLLAGLDLKLATRIGALGNNRTITLLDWEPFARIPLISIDTGRKDANGDADPVNLLGVDTQELLNDVPGITAAYDYNNEFAGIKVPFNQFFKSLPFEQEPKQDAQNGGGKPPESDQTEEPEPVNPTGIDLGSASLLIPNINTVSKWDSIDQVFITDPSKRLVRLTQPDGSIVEEIREVNNEPPNPLLEIPKDNP
jgi:hypothetical protein